MGERRMGNRFTPHFHNTNQDEVQKRPGVPDLLFFCVSSDFKISSKESHETNFACL